MTVVCGLCGCRTAPVYGLRPIDPPAVIENRGDPQNYLGYPDVGTLRPVLLWESFKPKAGWGADGGNGPGRITEITYDLRIWRAENGYPGEQVYVREGLRLPEHQLEEPLRGGNRYFWSIRPRFLLDGKPRVGRWGYTRIPWSPLQSRDYGSWSGRRVDEIPAYNFYRFRVR